MQNRVPMYVVALSLVAVFMTAGCATQDVVKKDEGLVPAPVAKRAEPQKSSVTPPTQAVTAPDTQIVPAAAAQPAQEALSNSKLQSALDKIYFDFDSANLSESARGTLTKNYATLIKGSSANIRIEGNCDESGSAEYNMALGEQRARAAQQYLVSLGVKPERLSVVSYGKEKPAVQGSDEASRAQNRRDEFVVVSRAK